LKYTTYENSRTVSTEKRGKYRRVPYWSVWEEDGSEDGRRVCDEITTLEEAEKIASLLNEQTP
jgi:hypothetical protein